MNVLHKLYYTLIFGAFLSPQISQAQTAKKYSVFKDGKAFIHAQDSVKAQNGKTLLPIPPQALFGTLWLNSPASAIKSVQTVAGGIGEKRSFSGLREMLSHNTGKKVRLILAYQEPLEATVSSVMNEYAVFKSKDRWISTNIDKIETIEFLEEPTVQIQESGNQLQIDWTNTTQANHFLTTAYMANGLGWVPEYQVILTDTDETIAEISLRAKLINDVEDLKNAEINFVAGAPEFRFGNVADPVASAGGFQQLLSQLNNTNSGQAQQHYFSNSFAGNTSSYNLQKPDAAGNIISSVSGEGAEDLYYYALKNITLAKGGRASYPLINAKIPVKHIYTVNLDENSLFYPFPAKQNKSESTVYHKLELSNTTSQPFTSGSAFLVKQSGGNTRPLAQNILTFAPKGGKTQVQIAAVPDIVVTDKEKETSREKSNSQENENLQVSIEGEINLKNYKDKEVTLEIRRTVTGELLKSDVNWKVSKEADFGTGKNAITNVLWEVILKPGEAKSINYKYKVMVSNQ